MLPGIFENGIESLVQEFGMKKKSKDNDKPTITMEITMSLKTSLKKNS